MSEQPEYVAVRAKVRKDGGKEVYLRNGPDDAWVPVGDAADDFIAPWLSRPEQEMVLRALEHAEDEINENGYRDPYTCGAIALLQSRLYPDPQPAQKGNVVTPPDLTQRQKPRGDTHEPTAQ